jgi:hypothetical protein
MDRLLAYWASGSSAAYATLCKVAVLKYRDFWRFYADVQLLSGVRSCGRRARKWRCGASTLQHSPSVPWARRARSRAASDPEDPRKIRAAQDRRSPLG